MREIMMRAHKIARELEGDYRARMSLALRIAWKEVNQELKDEVKVNPGEFSFLIKNVVSKTEKAVLIEFEYNKWGSTKTWIPLSAIREMNQSVVIVFEWFAKKDRALTSLMRRYGRVAWQNNGEAKNFAIKFPEKLINNLVKGA